MKKSVNEMKEEMIKKFLEYLQESKDFVLQETPEIFQQTIRYQYISNVIGFFFCLLVFFSMIGIFLYFYKNPILDEYENRDFISSTGCFLPCIFGFFSFIFILSCFDSILKITLAPKYYLITLFMSLSK